MPALVQNGRLDVPGMNTLGRALFSEMFEDRHTPANLARYLFLDPHATRSYRHWYDSAPQIVALLRTEAGRTPQDRNLSNLVGELTTGSQVFGALWASHDVREHRTGTKAVTHPVVGNLDLSFDALDVSSERGLQLIAFSAEPRSSTADALRLLAAGPPNRPPPAPSAATPNSCTSSPDIPGRASIAGIAHSS